jgi:arsenite methyltransferase
MRYKNITEVKMDTTRTIGAINERYSKLASSSCCLSCGGAINHSEVLPGEICLDLGSGRGSDTIRLAQKAGASGFAYGIDASDGMLEKSRSLAEKLGVRNVRFIKSDLGSIPIGDGSVDCVISNCTINHAPDKRAVWNEIFRVLKKGGRFIVSDIYAIAEVPGEYGKDPVAVAECWAGAVTRGEYLEQIEKAGLVVTSVAEESAPYAKGKIEVASFTVIGNRPSCCCSCE